MQIKEINPLPFRTKICGITSLSDATMAIGSGAEAIGLNFYSKSNRSISLETGAEIGVVHSTTAPIVAVAVNSSLEEISQIRRAVDIGWIQLHGDESPQFIGRLKREFHLPVIRAFRWQAESGQAISSYLERCAQLDCLPDAILIDAYKPGQFGGTGIRADWDAIANWRDRCRLELPLVLAGGLCAENVADAIARVRPDAVDTASGVESSPGKKDAKRVVDFVVAANQAFAVA